MDKNTKVEAISLDAIITVEISGAFYARVHQLLQTMMISMTPEAFKKAMESIKAEKPDSEISYHLQTVISLINGIEIAAKDQGKISMKEVEETNEG